MLCPPAHTEGSCADKCGTLVPQTELYLPNSVCDQSKGIALYPGAHIQSVSVGALPTFYPFVVKRKGSLSQEILKRNLRSW